MNKNLPQCRFITDINEPYVWRLHLSVHEYYHLHEYIRESILQHGGSYTHLLTKEYALILITYLAEWYKRSYRSDSEVDSSKAVELTTHDFRKLWSLSGINLDKFVYQTDAGFNLWQYSIYVLGGLPIQHELSRNDNGKFLKLLCRIYHGEEYQLEELDNINRAFAFRQSILQKHSLYEYLREILSGSFDDSDETVRTLLINIREANNEVWKSKFRFEWIITNSKSEKTLSRRLRVWLNPEEIGKGLHQYLSFDRIHLWNVPEPQKLKMLHISIRWKNGDDTVIDIDRKKPLISYSNTGSENGFLSWGIDRYAVCRAIPTNQFTHFQIIAFDDYANEYIAQEECAKEWMQLWRIDLYKDEWTSSQKSQAQTAVLFNDHWSTDTIPIIRKQFDDKFYGLSTEWNFCYINSSISLQSESNRQITLYNRIGYDQVFTKLYNETIDYVDGGLISFFREDEEEVIMEERYPLIFNKEDIRVCYSKTKDAENSDADIEERVDIVEFKMENGRYMHWDDIYKPSYGINTLRTNIKGVDHILKVIYLPGPIVRNIEESTIYYKDMNGERMIYKDSVSRNKEPLHPTILIKVGPFEINVYRPIDLKEIYLDDKVHAYRDKGQILTIPYILKDRIKIAIFSKNGYDFYDCSQWSSIYHLINSNNCAPLKAWREGRVWEATALDGRAPDWLKITVGNIYSPDIYNLRFFIWNLYNDEAPKEVSYEIERKLQRGDIIFQDMRTPSEQLLNIVPLIGHPDPFIRNLKDLELRCFLIASEYQIYFDAFSPLRKVTNDNVKEMILTPLLLLRGNSLTVDDEKNLIRFADECRILKDLIINIEH